MKRAIVLASALLLAGCFEDWGTEPSGRCWFTTGSPTFHTYYFETTDACNVAASAQHVRCFCR